MYIMIREQLSTHQEGKYACTRNLSPPFFLTHLVPSLCLHPFGEDNMVLLDSIDPRTPVVSLDYIVGYHLHLIRRSFVVCIVYHAASSSPSHIAQLLLHSSIRRIQHSVVESVVYCTTSSCLSYSTRQQSERFHQREAGGVPGRGGAVIEGNNMAGRGGPF